MRLQRGSLIRTRRISTTRFAVWNSLQPNALLRDSDVDDFALTAAERTLFRALNARGVRFLVIGLGAAVLQGAPESTQHIDVWFEDAGADALRAAATDAGGFWVPTFGLRPPGIGGEGLERVDTVLTAHGLRDFAAEYGDAIDYIVDGIPLKVLTIERVIASKRSLNRPKDVAAIPALEAALRAKADEAR